MPTSSTIIRSLILSVGVLATAGLVYTLARQELTAALLPFLIVCALAVIAPPALQER